jgi:hypothetical protein
MKFINIVNIRLLSILALPFILYACDNKEEYPALVLDKSAAPAVAVTHIADSLTETYTYITLSSTMEGKIFYVALPEGSDVPAAVDIVLGKTSPASKFIEVKADSVYMVKLKGLASAEKFNLYAVSTNSDEGKYGEVSAPVSIQCPDYTSPFILDMLPKNGSIKIARDLSEIVLTFNEAVELTDISKITVVDAFDESDLGIRGEVTVSGTNVIISLTGEFAYLTDVAVLIEAGAFADMAGNTSGEYYLNDAEDAYVLTFSIGDIIDMDVFSGAYHCVANEIGYGEGISEYDVIVKGGSDAEGYFIQIQNINDWSGSVVYLSVDPEVDTCFFEDQSTNRIYTSTGEDIMLTGLDEYALSSVNFKPGNFTRDGSQIQVFGEIYVSAGYFGFYEFTFTKIDNSEAKINRDFSPISEQPLKFKK